MTIASLLLLIACGLSASDLSLVTLSSGTDSSRVQLEKSLNVAVQYEKQAQELEIVGVLNSRSGGDLLLEWLATLGTEYPEWVQKSPFYEGPRTNWGTTLVESN